MKMFNSFYLIVALLSLSSCGSLSEWKKSIVEGPSIFDSPAENQQALQQKAPLAPQPRPWNPQALQVNSSALSAAKDRWPWAQGYQLQRRAQILQLGPSYSELMNLDTSSDAVSELQVLRTLLQKRQRMAYSSY